MTTMSETLSPLPQPPAGPKHVVDEGYRSALRFSFIAHAIFIGAVVFKSLVFPSKAKPYIPTLRVDMVALPDALKKDLQNLPPTASNKDIAKALKEAEADAKNIKSVKIPVPPKVKEPVETAEKDELVLHPKKTAVATPEEKPAAREKKLKSAMDRIKALDKIRAMEDGDKPSHRAVVVKGNKISKGTSLSGDAKEAAEANYNDLLRARLQENWELPVWIARQNLSAQVQVYIDGRGKVRSFRFMKPSGNAQFDAAIKKTLEESQPFPTPPEGIVGSLLADGILIGFPL
jgi:TonB family protein